MALSKEQLMYINNIMYAKSPSIYGQQSIIGSSYEGKTLGEFVADLDELNSAGLEADSTEWRRLKSLISSDTQLKNLVIANADVNDATGDARCLLVDPTTNDATLVFKGTGHNEWHDNFIAGTTMENCGVDPTTEKPDPTLSVQQAEALNYAQSLDLSNYNHVTVTGHSKGGNKAKLCALYYSDIDECVSFDGQGFSDEFMAAHADKIAKNQGKITNHNIEGDFVNILLNDIGETHYYQGQRMADNFAENHAPASFFTFDGKMVEGTQSPAMIEADKFLNSYLRSMDTEQKQSSLDLLGQIVQTALGDNNPEGVPALLLDPKNSDDVAYLLAYTLRYEQETGQISKSVVHVMDELGLDGLSTISNLFGLAMKNDALAIGIRVATMFGDDVPDWMLDGMLSIAEGLGLDLPREEIKSLIRIFGKASDYTAEIDIDKNNGGDISVPPAPPAASSGEPRYADVDMNFDVTESPGTGMFIFVQFSELLESCRLLNEALECYNRAVQDVRVAAEELASKWEGSAKDAFCRHQQSALRWYGGISGVIDAAVRLIQNLNKTYSDTESRAMNAMRS